ncbi:MAG TPA: [protein-PII] uridylyltransferase [Micromonosporaceae bacterium]|nr:[protein-PII] uridylyltransferase [Micromonosporaceae bacterium]
MGPAGRPDARDEAGAAIGAAAREARAAALDRLLGGAYAAATADLPAAAQGGIALVATGGLGRRDGAPHSDLDLMLLHEGTAGDLAEVAGRLWYPLWDLRLGLDHAVRTVPEALSVALDDPRVALALLDARCVAGDVRLAAALRTAGLDQWRRTAGRALTRLRDAAAERAHRHGDLAFLLEGDVKEARGGLRDVQLLRAVSTLGVTDAYRPEVRAAHTRLLDVRDALHVTAGRRTDRILAQDREAVAGLLDLRDGDALLRRVSTDARAVAYALDDAWRAVERWRRPATSARAVRVPIARDVVAQDGEVVLARTAIGPAPDPSLSLRVAAASATSGLPVARGTLDWLARFAPPLPRPWPAAARQAFVTLLGAADNLVAAWEAADRAGLVGTWLPEWIRLRGLPQHHPIHIWTVDRHSVLAAVEAAAFVREVARPDLLLVGALLHDIGKGLPGDHSEMGAPLAAAVAGAIGFPEADRATVARLVRLHLLLPSVATRRDLGDPATVSGVATAVGDTDTLDLLHALCRADAAAAGPAATSRWKDRLIAELVARVRDTLSGRTLPTAPADRPVPSGPLPIVEVTDEEVTVVAPDRRGLLAAVAGALALHRLDVLAADTWTVGERAVVRARVATRYGRAVDRTRLVLDLREAAEGDLPADRLARLGGAGRVRGREPTVSWHTDATEAVVVELRAPDAPGLLHRVTGALAALGADVRAARVATLGGDVVDAFYLVGPWSDEVGRRKVSAAVLAAAGSV